MEEHALSLAHSLLGQCRRPSGPVGAFVLWTMNRSHARLTDWGLGHVAIGARDVVLDVGCGGGRTVQKLAARAAQGRVSGIDFSSASVAAARRTNRAAIAAGRVEIREGTVSNLPYPEAAFDLVTAVETHYYWPDLPADVREVRRVLRPAGTFLLVAEAYRSARHGALERHAGALQDLVGFRLLTLDEHHALLEGAGFAEVELFEERARGWMCARGRRPA